MSHSEMPVITPEYLAANKGPQILTIVILFPALASLIVGFRLYTRFSVVRSPSYEDLAIVLALVCQMNEVSGPKFVCIMLFLVQCSEIQTFDRLLRTLILGLLG